MSQKTIMNQIMHHKDLFLYVGPISVLFVISGLTAFSFNNSYIKPGVLAWFLASINFIVALWSLTVAQKKDLLHSMLFVFGAGGFRMVLMILAIIVIMVKKNTWMAAFCMILLECFFMYLIVEVVVIYKRGLLQKR